jgi:hypothetical protein
MATALREQYSKTYLQNKFSLQFSFVPREHVRGVSKRKKDKYRHIDRYV